MVSSMAKQAGSKMASSDVRSEHRTVLNKVLEAGALPKAPELNPVENVWQFLRENWLSNRDFRSYEDILRAV